MDEKIYYKQQVQNEVKESNADVVSGLAGLQRPESSIRYYRPLKERI